MAALTGSGYARGSVPVRGGDLAYGRWGGDGPLVLAVHGITSHHLAFGLVGPLLADGFTVVAPDLRGRGASRDLPEPYGMTTHAEDVAALVEAHGGHAAVVLGHSIGGWVAVELARRRPDLLDALVLVDGGAPLPPPSGLAAGASDEEVSAAVRATVGAAYERLTRTFATVEDYRALWQAHPAMQPWSPAIETYADYDLVGRAPDLQPSCRLEAALRDARDLYVLAGATPRPVGVPSVFLRAERGMLDQPEGMYAAGHPGAWLPGTPEVAVPGVNHYSIVLGDLGAQVVADWVRSAATARPGIH